MDPFSPLFADLKFKSPLIHRTARGRARVYQRHISGSCIITTQSTINQNGKDYNPSVEVANSAF